jgi:hypothetical protein
MIVFDVKLRPQIFEKLTDIVDVGPGAEIFRFGCTDDLIPMLVGPGQKKSFYLLHGIEPAGNIGNNCRERMP